MKRLKNLTLLTLTALLGALLAGCIVKDTTHTLHLDPDGAVTWTVLEDDVRSDADKRSERRREEREYIDNARAGTHDVAEAFRALGVEPQTRVLRGRRPFSVRTEARFASIAKMLEDLLYASGADAKVSFTAGPDEFRLTASVDISNDSEARNEAVTGLLGFFESKTLTTRIVLTEGRFTEAVGFRLDEDARVATPMIDELEEEGEDAPCGEQGSCHLDLVLAWTVDIGQ